MNDDEKCFRVVNTGGPVLTTDDDPRPPKIQFIEETKAADIHERKCWDCGNVAEHESRIAPEVCCKKCGSQDTRATKKPVGPPATVSRNALVDDDEPLTDEWFRNRWPEDHQEDRYAVECDSGVWFEVDLYGENCFAFHIGGCGWDGERFKTRGDVRNFLWYMQSEFIP